MDEVIQTILVSEFQIIVPNVQDKIMYTINHSLSCIKKYFDESQLETSTHMGTNLQQTWSWKFLQLVIILHLQTYLKH